MRLINDFFSITSFNEDAQGGFVYSIKLNQEHSIYKVHFPNNPITPGACILQIVTELLEHRLNRELCLDCVNNVKYLNILSPLHDSDADFAYALLQMEDGSGFKAKVVVKNNEKVFAKISLTYNYEL